MSCACLDNLEWFCPGIRTRREAARPCSALLTARPAARVTSTGRPGAGDGAGQRGMRPGQVTRHARHQPRQTPGHPGPGCQGGSPGDSVPAQSPPGPLSGSSLRQCEGCEGDRPVSVPALPGVSHHPVNTVPALTGRGPILSSLCSLRSVLDCSRSPTRVQGGSGPSSEEHSLSSLHFPFPCQCLVF